MKKEIIAITIYGVILIIGGVVGFVKGQSIPSLAMGSLFGSLMCLGAARLSKGDQKALSYLIGTTAFLSCFFLYRYVQSYKFMPAGIMAILSILMLSTLFRAKPVEVQP
ncbi:MAG: transrane protein [Chlamydiales bacterium]|jgi:uncharacterized membrane protein (UPF0136 family)|nr:transrane protein [Chlamydiales bacterium]